MHEAAYDVIIAGAGPAGLFLAGELALAKCSVLVLERARDPDSPLKAFPFGIRGLSAPTIEALDRRGLLTELTVHTRLKDPHKTAATREGSPPRRQGGHFAGIPFYFDQLDGAEWPYRLPSSTQTNLLSEVQELEWVFGRRAAALGVEIRRGCQVTGVQQTADGVNVRSEDRFFAASWLVGCDGSRSVVRKAIQTDFAGTEPEFTGYSILLDLVDPQKLKLGRNLTPTGMYLQSQPGYIAMLDFDGGVAHRSNDATTRENIQAVLRRVSNTDVTVRAVHVATSWTDRARQAAAYRDGRVLIAGDAAHIHSPLGGQGLNLGVGDAMNLGWKLAATVQGRAPEGLLDSYQTERHPVGAQVLDWSRAQVAIMRPSRDARALNAVVRDLMSTRDGATYIAGRVWGVSTHYEVAEKHPLVGRSVPNFAFSDGTTAGSIMRDGTGKLLDFDANGERKAIADAYRTVQYVSVRADQDFGLSAALVRPDGIVAWASDGGSDCSGLESTAATWFGRRPTD